MDPRIGYALPHALVVGGTGMLSGVCLHLVRRGHVVSVIARGRAGLDRLAGETVGLPGRLNPMALDYAQDARLRAALIEAIGEFGPLDLAVTWIHAIAPKALMTVADCADRGAAEAATGPCRFFRVLGSAAADPALDRKGKGGRFKAMRGIAYREIVLGFRIENGTSRSNTNAEIAAGVIDAIEHDREESVVGVVRPWERHPKFTRRG